VKQKNLLRSELVPKFEVLEQAQVREIKDKEYAMSNVSMRRWISDFVESREAVYKQIALDIHERPEVSNYEFYACKRLSDQLEAEGFTVRVDVAGHRTGFSAVYRVAKPGPVIVFLAEYDALVELGHGCGHNLYGATSLLAAASLKQVIEETGGEVRVYGTPGEEGGENGCSKADFVREGLFKDVDAALCAHPNARDHRLTEKTLACAAVDIEFWGKSAHASAAPELGINALDALIQVYNAINALRQHLPQDVRIHGIITRGGDAPNTIPDYAKAKFYLRSASALGLDAVYHKVERIVEGAALSTGAKGSMRPYQNLVENTVPTPSFDEIYRKNLELLGEKAVPSPCEVLPGSSDVGNVSQVVPVIQPFISISDDLFAAHTEEMKAAARSERGLASILLGAKALAYTALDLLKDPALLAAIQAEHRKLAAEQGAQPYN
jgi:amidohydrolase